MNRSRFVVVPELKLEELAAYHDDLVASFRFYFSNAPLSGLIARFADKSNLKIAAELQSRLLESDARSALAVLSSLEAYFRVDFSLRCQKRLKDELSRYFRDVEKTRGAYVRLNEDILEGWKRYTDAPAILISQLRAAFQFRHWLAHGRYWSPKLGQKYDFEGVYVMASAIISAFKFAS